MYLSEIFPEDLSGSQQFAMLLVTYVNRWIWLVAILGFAHHFLNRPFPWLRYANDAVYPWYVLHQTITVVAGYWLSQLALGPVAESALLLVATIGGCAVLHELVIRRSRLLRPLFGMNPLRAGPPDIASGIGAGGTTCPLPAVATDFAGTDVPTRSIP